LLPPPILPPPILPPPILPPLVALLLPLLLLPLLLLPLLLLPLLLPPLLLPPLLLPPLLLSPLLPLATGCKSDDAGQTRDNTTRINIIMSRASCKNGSVLEALSTLSSGKVFVPPLASQ
jgi:hypothetical protein